MKMHLSISYLYRSDGENQARMYMCINKEEEKNILVSKKKESYFCIIYLEFICVTFRDPSRDETQENLAYRPRSDDYHETHIMQILA